MYGNKIQVTGNDCVMRGRRGHKSYFLSHGTTVISQNPPTCTSYLHTNHYILLHTPLFSPEIKRTLSLYMS